MSTAVWSGALAVVAVPVAEAGGLTVLWAALACANLPQAVTKTASFRNHSARIGATPSARAAQAPTGPSPDGTAGTSAG